jgi:hypothetical protein
MLQLPCRIPLEPPTAQTHTGGCHPNVQRGLTNPQEEECGTVPSDGDKCIQLTLGWVERTSVQHPTVS